MLEAMSERTRLDARPGLPTRREVQSSDAQYDRVVGPARSGAVQPKTAVSAWPADEYVLVGGGLQNALLALALLEQRPEARLTLLEREERLGGNHTWCFHAGDVPASARSWIDRLVVKRWAAHDVYFPRHQRRLEEEYCAVDSPRLHSVVSERIQAAPNARIITGSARRVGARSVVLEDGRELAGQFVIDARGPTPGVQAGGYQKFLGLELQLAAGSAPEMPVLMDATVAQLEGFRFFYVLPWAPDRVLVEDTYYCENSRLERDVLRQRVLDYAQAKGMPVLRVLREEHGVLPIPTRVAAHAQASAVQAGRAHTEVQPGTSTPVLAGYAGGLFHPTTGYSFPIALRFALHLASRPVQEAFGAEYQSWLARHQRQVRFGVLLNRLLFEAFAPAERYRVLERFYRLPAATIRRFYALETSATDRARILCGRPPSGFSLRRLLAGGDDT
jgi:lycopene beta-cyclase